MKSYLAVIAVTMLVTSAFAADVRLPATGAARFPQLKASNLESREFNLPQDFAGERNLVLIAFQREQQAQLDTWLKEMKRFQEVDPGFQYYELPTIEKMNSFMRWFIDSGMRRGIPDKNARARTITLYIDKKPFLESLQLPSEKTVYALLVDRSGTVLWRAEGTFDEAKGENLRKALQAASN
jgi:hypothetical protein